jgi:3-deoxy-7-phosphoheptulonate synthase
MIIVMHADATDAQIEAVAQRIREHGLDINVSRGIERTLVGAIGDERKLNQELFETMPGVEQALHIVKPYKIVAREWHKQDTVIDL